MSNAQPSCFGKLPFRLMDSLQRHPGLQENYWADAIPVPASDVALTTIDSISLDQRALPASVVLAILHSMNDIFAANGIPTAFSVSLLLPPTTDADSLSEINQAILKCADMAQCKIGKFHTVRAEGTASATVSVIGTATDTRPTLAKEGTVILVGGRLGATVSGALVHASAELKARRIVAANIAGPKKDISGDGLVGALYQLALRHAASIEVSTEAIPDIAALRTESELELLNRNYTDYASFISAHASPLKRETLFAPRVFGPLICLTEQAVSTDQADIITIGSFRASGQSLRFV